MGAVYQHNISGSILLKWEPIDSTYTSTVTHTNGDFLDVSSGTLVEGDEINPANSNTSNAIMVTLDGQAPGFPAAQRYQFRNCHVTDPMDFNLGTNETQQTLTFFAKRDYEGKLFVKDGNLTGNEITVGYSEDGTRVGIITAKKPIFGDNRGGPNGIPADFIIHGKAAEISITLIDYDYVNWEDLVHHMTNTYS